MLNTAGEIIDFAFLQSAVKKETFNNNEGERRTLLLNYFNIIARDFYDAMMENLILHDETVTETISTPKTNPVYLIGNPNQKIISVFITKWNNDTGDLLSYIPQNMLKTTLERFGRANYKAYTVRESQIYISPIPEEGNNGKLTINMVKEYQDVKDLTEEPIQIPSGERRTLIPGIQQLILERQKDFDGALIYRQQFMEKVRESITQLNEKYARQRKVYVKDNPSFI